MAKRRGLALDGVLLLDKPVGLSSNHALQRAKRTVDAAKAGHTGTLDPFATGLLLCCMGRATKISGAMLNADKTYRATLQFGEETDSGDLTGNVVATAAPGFTVTEQALRDALSRFSGTIEQIPPMYSALKRDGKPLYEYARQGIELERPPRQSRFTASSCCPCPGRRQRSMSHAVKARTSARWPRTSGARWVLCPPALRRTHVGPFSLDRAVTLDALQAMPDPKQALLALNELPEGLLPSKTLKDSL